MLCPFCAKPNQPDAAFCTACGKMLGALDHPVQSSDRSATDPGMRTLRDGPGRVARGDPPAEAPPTERDQPPSITAPSPSDRSYITDMSISLAAIGVRSPTRSGLMALGVMLGLVALGAGGMYLVMWLTRPEPAALVSVPEPDESPLDLGLMVVGLNDAPEDGEPDGGSANEATEPEEPRVADPTPARRQPRAPRTDARRASSTTVEAPRPAPDREPSPTAEEPMDMDTYSRRVRGLVTVFYAAQAQRCFPESARGTVTVRFTIQPDGRVSEPSVVQDSTGDPSVGRCLLRQVSSWHLTPPPNGRPTAFSLTFAQ